MIIVQSLLLTLITFSALSIVWSTIQYGISPMPSNRLACEAMLQLASKTKHKLIFELGSGWGHVAHQLARHHPHSMVYGYETSLLPFLFARLFFRRDNLIFCREDFRNASFPPDSLLVCYLYPKGMTQLSEHPSISQCWIISNTFALPHHREQETISLTDLYRSKIHLYRIEK